MPELPEVQTVVDDLNNAGLVGSSIIDATVNWHRTLANYESESFRSRISGCRIVKIWRRAKYIVFDLVPVLNPSFFLAVHLRMTGRFELNGIPGESKHVHVVLALDDGRYLSFHDTRKFGRFFLVEQIGDFFSRLGPEPLEKAFTAESLARGLKKRDRQIKPLLLDQAFLAGLGNIYVDEALWRAKIHPRTRSRVLTRRQVSALHRSIRKVLRDGLRNAGTTLGTGQGNFSSIGNGYGRNRANLNVFRRTGEPCPRCRSTIQRIMVAQRSSHYCPTCQAEESNGLQDNSSESLRYNKKTVEIF